MGISLYFAARRATPLTPEESQLVDTVLERAHRSRPPPCVSLYAVPENEIDVAEEGWFLRFSARAATPGKVPDVFSGSIDMPLVDRWPAVHELILHWCEAFTEVRRALEAAEWRAHLDDFQLEWDANELRFRPPTKLDAARYRASVAFARGG